MSPTVQTCADEVRKQETEKKFKMKLTYFAVQFYGECWAGGNSVADKYFIYGSSKNCYKRTGGPSVNFVYRFGSEKSKLFFSNSYLTAFFYHRYIYAFNVVPLKIKQINVVYA